MAAFEDLAAPAPCLMVFVPGKAAPQGSKRLLGTSGGKSIAVESSKHVAPWRADVRAAVTDRLGTTPALDGPVTVTLGFILPRAKSHYRTGRNAHLLRDGAPVLPAGKPDVDKLARAVLDAIGSAGAWKDDSQVVNLHAQKTYAGSAVKPGAWITITPLEAL